MGWRIQNRGGEGQVRWMMGRINEKEEGREIVRESGSKRD